jgi:peroxiredoxin
MEGLNPVSDIAHPSLKEQIETLQQQSAGKTPPEVRERMKARRIQLTQSGIADKSLKVGETAPDFTLPDAYGQPVTLSALLTHGPVVLTFYRGDWCPYCNLTLRSYQAVLPEISLLHSTLVAVSPQNPDNTLLTVQHKELTYPVLSDLGNLVARQYRLVWSIPEDQRSTSANLPQYNGDDAWELPMPGTFVIGQDGIVKLASVNADWTLRLEPQIIVATLRQLDSTQG